jgi:Leucine-rich repeat (LRR) protein
MAKTTIDRIIYPVQTKRGLKYPKKKMIPGMECAGSGFVPRDVMADAQAIQSKSGKLLDGFLILYSCRVKLPHEAIKSKLDGQNIMQVIEEDLCYFQNLSAIDLADNHVRLEQLKNLKSLVEINLQYNYIREIKSLGMYDFEKLETLNLSYNSITPASIRQLYNLRRLKTLDLQANNLVTLPEDIRLFESLEELNLSSN